MKTKDIYDYTVGHCNLTHFSCQHGDYMLKFYL
jgi:hypothetical protein